MPIAGVFVKSPGGVGAGVPILRRDFANGRYADVADTLKSVPADQRVAVGGSYVERALIDLLEGRALELAG